MDKNIWENIRAKFGEALPGMKKTLSFLKPSEEDVGFEDSSELNMRQINSAETGKTRRVWEKKEGTGGILIKNRTAAIVIAAAAAAAVVGGFIFYNSHHTFREYVVLRTEENLDIDNTGYVMLGSSIAKYSSDGVFCANTHNTTKWSSAFSMQTPIVDVCNKTMVVAEQQGKQVYVFDEKGMKGSFETTLPILKAHVSAQGVTALILDDDEVAWIELFDTEGNELAKIKTTIEDSGYPLDMALTENASRMMVSFAGIIDGVLTGRIAFYDFTSSSSSDESHLTGIIDYKETVFPTVFFADAATPVALSDGGMVVFKNGKEPQEKTKLDLETEIVSSFHDANTIGFVVPSQENQTKYEMQLYHYNGKKVMSKNFDCEYTEVKMDHGEILLYDDQNCTVYTTSGTCRFSSDYEKQVEFFAEIPGFRKYLIITNDSMDTIRIS